MDIALFTNKQWTDLMYEATTKIKDTPRSYTRIYHVKYMEAVIPMINEHAAKTGQRISTHSVPKLGKGHRIKLAVAALCNIGTNDSPVHIPYVEILKAKITKAEDRAPILENGCPIPGDAVLGIVDNRMASKYVGRSLFALKCSDLADFIRAFITLIRLTIKRHTH